MEKIYRVGDVTRLIKSLLSHEPLLQNIMIRGEISNYRKYSSGHAYFTLKDKDAGIRCVMFYDRAKKMRFTPTDGMSVIAGGSVSVYERDGAYQFYVDTMVPEGTGDLALAFEELKSRLKSEGLFDAEHKKRLPIFPNTVGIVTSPHGAVLRDMYRIIRRRFPAVRLVLLPVQVQGESAAAQIAWAINFINEKYPVDLIIVGRGGGSAEDLWCFNEEVVVRAIYDSEIPIISAVGHETDFTLSDFAADVRAATPSEAAELAVPDAQKLTAEISSLCSRLTVIKRRWMREKRRRLREILTQRFMRAPKDFLAERKQQTDAAYQRLIDSSRAGADMKRKRLDEALARLELLNPAGIMRRGYAIAESGAGDVIRSVREVERGDSFKITLSDGSLLAKVLEKDIGREFS